MDSTTPLTPEDVDVALQYLRRRCGLTPQTAVILGSGIPGPAGRAVAEVPYRDVPYLQATSVPGHRGSFIFAEVGGVPVLICDGRLHPFEGVAPAVAALPVRLAARLGCRFLIVTGAVGSLRPDFAVGDAVVIKDHINIIAASPLAGPAFQEFGPRFVAAAQAYDAQLNAAAVRFARERGFSLKEAVYAAVPGPAYETAAEARALAILGADVVGMSVVNDVLAARQARMRAVGLCAVVNVAGTAAADHDEVLRQAAVPGARVAEITGFLVEHIHAITGGKV